MRLVLILLFIIVPIAELALLIQVGQAIGVWWTVLILIADALLGSYLLRTQGRLAWRRFNEALAAGRAPAREVADGVLIIFGGALLLTPGFISDIFGVLFLLPPTRALIRRLFLRRAIRRMTASMRVATFPAGNGAGSPFGRAEDFDYEGTAVDVDPRRPGLGR